LPKGETIKSLKIIKNLYFLARQKFQTLSILTKKTSEASDSSSLFSTPSMTS